MDQAGETKRDVPPLTGNEAAHHLVLDQVQRGIKLFRGYTKINRAAVLKQPLTVENRLLTLTMKLKGMKVVGAHRAEFGSLYAGH